MPTQCRHCYCHFAVLLCLAVAPISRPARFSLTHDTQTHIYLCIYPYLSMNWCDYTRCCFVSWYYIAKVWIPRPSFDVDMLFCVLLYLFLRMLCVAAAQVSSFCFQFTSHCIFFLDCSHWDSWFSSAIFHSFWNWGKWNNLNIHNKQKTS